MNCDSCLKQNLEFIDRFIIKIWAEGGYNITLCNECATLFSNSNVQKKILELFDKIIDDYTELL